MSHNIRPAQLTLTPHHLFYILSRLEELDISIGPMNIRLENIHTETSPANYVSFLHQPQSKRRGDRDSIHSVSSARSVLSGMSALWSSFGLGGGSAGITRSEKAKAAFEADLKYLYSAFTKLPSLRLSPDHRARLIRGYEEFPFDTAVPLFAFKNVQSLDIVDMDFRQFYGWDRLAEQLRLLTVKRANLDDPRDLITNIVLDDADRRRFRSTKPQSSSALACSVPSPMKSAVFRSNSDPGSPGRLSTESPTLMAVDGEIKDGESPPKFAVGSMSPTRPFPTRPNSSYRHIRSYSKAKRSGSGSSNSSEQSLLPQQSEMLFGSLSLGTLPATKWRFLKYLSLADNSLTSISASSLLPLANTLRSLNLSSNLFTEIPDSLSSLTRLSSLDLSNCMIESLHSLSKSPLPAITTLKLRSNRLTSLAGIERLLSLENLNVQDNKILDPMEVARLTGLPNMHRIYVKRNPLTRRSDHRIKIFNLFRNTPGYSEDVVVDDNGPSYGERKLLQDRVPEGDKPPVIRPVEVIQLLQPSKSQDKSVSVPSSRSSGVIEKAQAEHIVASTRRRKVPRRRIVDLSREEEQGSGLASADLITFGPLLGNSVAGQSTCIPPDQADPLRINQSETRSSIDTNQDDFRQRVEALKHEVGDRWLSVLRDQGIEGSVDPMLNGNTVGRLMAPIRGPHSQVLVSGGRTLG